MSSEPSPTEARPGKGAAGDQWAVQTAQTTDVNPPDARIPSGADEELDRKQVEAEAEQEKSSGLSTTAGFFEDDAGQLDNVAVEPEMYVEE